MKKAILTVVSLTLALVVFIAADENKKENEIITEIYKNKLEELGKTADGFAEIAEKFGNGTANINQLKESYFKLRIAFKTTEFLLEYTDHDYVQMYINGIPFPTLEENVPTPTVLEPEGLQIIDELMFLGEAKESAAKISYLAGRLSETINDIKNYQKNIVIQNRYAFEAIRFQLIRIISLGLTGFDVPGSGNSMKDALVSMNSLAEAYSVYHPALSKRNKKLAVEIDKLFSGALRYLEANSDFDSFDRLSFLTGYINPLFSDFLKAQLAFGIETIYEVDKIKKSNNYLADNIFSNDFLNPYYYMINNENEDSEELNELGRLLFFDPVLSANNERSCASCHLPELAFSDGKMKSAAFDVEGTVDRNSPTLINAVFAAGFFHDLRAPFLESQIEHVIASPKEFNADFIKIISEIKESPEYVEMFDNNFSKVEKRYRITKQSISLAIASYVKTLKGFNSPFDKYVRGETKTLPEEVKRGFNLFAGKAACGTCHFIPTFNGTVPPYYRETDSEVLGVPETTDTVNAVIDPDVGRAKGVLRKQSDIFLHSFKTATVRNIELTAPYMHNGVYESLEEVIRFYDIGGGAGLGIDLPNQTLPPDSLKLTQQEKDDLIAFMKALTDTTGITYKPQRLPEFPNNPELNKRRVGGLY